MVRWWLRSCAGRSTSTRRAWRTHDNITILILYWYYIDIILMACAGRSTSTRRAWRTHSNIAILILYQHYVNIIFIASVQAALHRRGGRGSPLGPGLLRHLLRARRWRYIIWRFYNIFNYYILIIFTIGFFFVLFFVLVGGGAWRYFNNNDILMIL